MAYADGQIARIERAIVELEKEFKEKLPDRVYELVEKWIERVAADARANLARPKWLLTKHITPKIKKYQSGQKIWAAAGFRFRVKNDKRDPGYYGQFHEAGWRPGGKRVSVKKKFIKRAKKKNLPQLHQDLRDLVESIVKAHIK